MPHRRSHRPDQTLVPGETTRYEKAAVVLIPAIPMLAMAGYGAVDVWSLIPLSLLTIILLLLWTADGLKTGHARFNVSPLQIPLIALIGIGCIQLLPFGDAGAGAELPGLSVSASLSLDAFATRIFTVRLF